MVKRARTAQRVVPKAGALALVWFAMPGPSIEVINTGTELLLGSVINTHAAFFGKRLLQLGLRVSRQTCVPDGDAIRQAIQETIGRAEIVLITGGLGPTTDDITRDAVAELLGLALEVDETVLDAIRKRFEKRGIVVTDRIARQAQVPTGAEVLPNPNGTAPGLFIPAKIGFPHFFLLPGPPRELTPMFDAEVNPRLRQIAGEQSETSHTFRLAGMGESQVEATVGAAILALGNVELGYCARVGEVDVRCVGNPQAVAEAAAIIKASLAEHIFGEAEETLERAVVARLTGLRATVATAESCTGGLLANRITDVPGASQIFLGGFVPYSNEAKISALGVPAATIEEFGAVSEPTAIAMAQGALAKTGSDYALSTTGIAGPGGGTEEKPVGTVYIALASKDAETVVEKHSFRFERETFKRITTQTALNMLRRKLRQELY